MKRRIKVLVVTSLIAAFVAVGPVSGSASAQASKGTCAGLEVTVDIGAGDVPTEGADVIRGTNRDDNIAAFGGDDTICALAGDDLINSGEGFDDVFAGAGDDVIVGGAGNDLLVGGAGIDTIFGDAGNDRIQGGDGNDALQGGGGLDRVAGGNGNDAIVGGTHSDVLFGNLGRDTLRGGGGDDILRGGAWADTMDGGPGNDRCTLTDPGGLTEVRDNCELGLQGNINQVPVTGPLTALSRVTCGSAELNSGLDLLFGGTSADSIWSDLWPYGVPRGGWAELDGVDVATNSVDFVYVDDLIGGSINGVPFDESELGIFEAEDVHTVIVFASVRNGQLQQFRIVANSDENLVDRSSPGFAFVDYPDSYNTGAGGQLVRFGDSLRIIDSVCSNPQELGGL